MHQFGVAKTPDNKFALVFLFPYFNGFSSGNLSLYAKSRDYHLTVQEYLEKIKIFIKSLQPDFEGKCYCDVSPYNEKALAQKAGLGFYGKNQLLINSAYGSFFFIGIIVTDTFFQEDLPLNLSCKGCNKCIEACPGNALGSNGFNKSLCGSEISQKKGDLSLQEREIFIKTGLIWGCDICQNVCPHNENLEITPLPEFSQNIMHSVTTKDLRGLSNKTFKKQFGNRAFSWRGKGVLERNLSIMSKT